MAEINRISSFKTFSEIKATQVATKLAEENATKRSVLATKISTLLDEMEITSFEDLAEDTKREFITKAFGNVSEEEVEIEIEVADEIEDEEVDESLITEAKFTMKKLLKGMKKPCGMIKLTDGRELRVCSYLDDADFHESTWDDYAVFAEDPDTDPNEDEDLGAEEITYDEIVSYSEPKNMIQRIAESNQSFVNEALVITGKRDAKKVFNQYVKIWNEYSAFGAAGTKHTLGILKQLFFEAMEDANFSREAYSLTKLFKGKIQPLTMKVDSLGGLEVKVPMPKFREAIDQVYSRIANASGWSGIGIVEGTAMFLDSIGEVKTAESLINGFNTQFESVQIRDTRVEEGRAFVAAAKKAKDAGEKEFEYDGKTFPVLIKESKTVLNEGTRGQFGKIDKKGNITSVYTHYDSYPDNMLPIIKKSFKNGKNVDDVIAKGNNSGLDATVANIKYYNDDSAGEKGTVKNIDKYIRTAGDESGAEFIYLWDEGSKTWMMADVYGGSGLVPAFESVVNEAAKPKEVKAVEKLIKAKGEEHFDVEGTWLFNHNSYNDDQEETVQFSWDAENGYDVTDEDGRELYVGTDAKAAVKAFKSVVESISILERNAFLGARAKAIEEDMSEFEFNGKTYKVTTKSKVNEGNAFGDAVRKAKEAGETEFEFEGETYKVEESEEVAVEEGNAFGDAVRKAKEAGETEFEFEGETYKVEEAKVNEAEIKSDEEFTEYANTVLQKAFGEDFDEAKAKEVIDGILSKSDGDYGAAVGMLTSSLG